MRSGQPCAWRPRGPRAAPARGSTQDDPFQRCQRSEDEKRSDDRRDDVSQRDPHTVESGEQPQQPEQQTADESANQAQPQVPPNAKAPALTPDDQPGNAPSEETNDYPNDELSE